MAKEGEEGSHINQRSQCNALRIFMGCLPFVAWLGFEGKTDAHFFILLLFGRPGRAGKHIDRLFYELLIAL